MLLFLIEMFTKNFRAIRVGKIDYLLPFLRLSSFYHVDYLRYNACCYKERTLEISIKNLNEKKMKRLNILNVGGFGIGCCSRFSLA
jgi:hypothetical protein